MSMSQPQGYLAVPPTASGAPVVVLHAWWGLNDTIKAFCDRLAGEGFAVFAPDLYHGKIARTVPEAEALSGALDERADQARAQIQQAVAFLAERAGAGSGPVSVIGFSLGAFYALDLSARMPERISKVVIFYGTGPADFSRARAAYLGHFAADDPYEPQSNVDWVAEALETAGRPFTFYSYAGTGHWFFEPDRPDAYNGQAAALAWERTLAFLRGG